MALKFSEQACSLPEATLDALSILTFRRFSLLEVLCLTLKLRGLASATSSRMISGNVSPRSEKPRRTSASASSTTVVHYTASAARWKSKAKLRWPDQLNDSARAKTTGSYLMCTCLSAWWMLVLCNFQELTRLCCMVALATTSPVPSTSTRRAKRADSWQELSCSTATTLRPTDAMWAVPQAWWSSLVWTVTTNTMLARAPSPRWKRSSDLFDIIWFVISWNETKK